MGMEGEMSYFWKTSHGAEKGVRASWGEQCEVHGLEPMLECDEKLRKNGEGLECWSAYSRPHSHILAFRSRG